MSCRVMAVYKGEFVYVSPDPDYPNLLALTFDPVDLTNTEGGHVVARAATDSTLRDVTIINR